MHQLHMKARESCILGNASIVNEDISAVFLVGGALKEFIQSAMAAHMNMISD